jgi:hypothetical protein
MKAVKLWMFAVILTINGAMSLLASSDNEVQNRRAEF